jgi:hypothetical protein
MAKALEVVKDTNVGCVKGANGLLLPATRASHRLGGTRVLRFQNEL